MSARAVPAAVVCACVLSTLLCLMCNGEIHDEVAAVLISELPPALRPITRLLVYANRVQLNCHCWAHQTNTYCTQSTHTTQNAAAPCAVVVRQQNDPTDVLRDVAAHFLHGGEGTECGDGVVELGN